uniref:Uncharacterized protein n=1 Tax=Lotus japonicus TaxID=34305 RepID=I3SBV9_LOTJA|nr:unknown [Lotus japonicus]
MRHRRKQQRRKIEILFNDLSACISSLLNLGGEFGLLYEFAELPTPKHPKHKVGESCCHGSTTKISDHLLRCLIIMLLFLIEILILIRIAIWKLLATTLRRCCKERFSTRTSWSWWYQNIFMLYLQIRVTWATTIERNHCCV